MGGIVPGSAALNFLGVGGSVTVHFSKLIIIIIYRTHQYRSRVLAMYIHDTRNQEIYSIQHQCKKVKNINNGGLRRTNNVNHINSFNRHMTYTSEVEEESFEVHMVGTCMQESILQQETLL